MSKQQIKARLEYLRGKIESERISYSEIAELQDLAKYIEPGDVQLLEWAGVPESKAKRNPLLMVVPNGRELSVPEQHQLKIALSTLHMAPAMARVMGGMSHDEAKKFLKSVNYTDAQIVLVRLVRKSFNQFLRQSTRWLGAKRVKLFCTTEKLTSLSCGLPIST